MRRAVLIPIALLLLTPLFFNQLAFTNGILARGDTYVYFYPYWGARDAALAAGQFPLWTPDLFTGAPLFSNPQLGTLYPPNWLTIGLNPPDSIRISILLHVMWAAVGMFLLARRILDQPIAAMVAAILFAFGGYIGAHVEQINQLQGLSWMPWLFWLFRMAHTRPTRFIPLIAIGFGLQLFTGHTQTVFITGMGLALYGLFSAWANRRANGASWLSLARPLFILVVAGGLGLLLAVPQLLPTLELTGLSNRGGGFNPQEVNAFSLSPLVLGRGLLPAYDAQVFGEYVAYVGVLGLGLVVIGLFNRQSSGRWVWFAIAIISLILALGAYTPAYWSLASLPGFNFFRVPARWLALFALSLSLLAGMGVSALISRQSIPRRAYATLGVIFGGLVAIALLAVPVGERIGLAFPDEGMVWGDATPDSTTLSGWALGLAAFVGLLWLSRRDRISPSRTGFAVISMVVIELLLAGATMPYHDLAPPDVYTGQRFTISQMMAYADDETVPGRLLSISGLLFDPGDRTALENRFARAGMDERATRNAFIAIKRQEMLFPNLPLAWDIPTIDGFGGGLLPTTYYTQFTSLLLPDGALRTIDGRLGEMLARPDCRGACVPDSRWLDLMGVRYLITDKVYDVWHEDVAYDTALRGGTAFDVVPLFQATAVNVLYSGDITADLVVDDDLRLVATDRIDGGTVAGLRLGQYVFDAPLSPATLRFDGAMDAQIVAVTLVDTRTGDFAQLTPQGWRRVLSSDVKIYERDNPPRAFLVYDVTFQPDTWDGSEAALVTMRDRAFNPLQQAVIHGDGQPLTAEAGTGRATITTYNDTHVEITVVTDSDAYLILTDAYFPGWTAALDGNPVDLYRADVMFRAVYIPAGEHTLTFDYAPAWWPALLVIGVVVWLGVIVVMVIVWRGHDQTT